MPARVDTLKKVERDCIVRALEEANWVVGGRNGAAARLGLPRTTLIYKMRKLRHQSELVFSANIAAQRGIMKRGRWFALLFMGRAS